MVLCYTLSLHFQEASHGDAWENKAKSYLLQMRDDCGNANHFACKKYENLVIDWDYNDNEQLGREKI